MKVALLYFDGCPNVETAYSRLKEALENLAPGTLIEKVNIQSEADARAHKFYGSPSVHIDGVDLEHDEARPSAMTCRIYDDGAPPRWLIEAKILRAQSLKGILFLCVANSARSQIAEGIARKLAPPNVQIQSAGSHPTSVRSEAIQVLSELGIDPAAHRSKNVSDIEPSTVDTVITLCAEEECPLFIGRAFRLHWGLPDPAAWTGPQETRLNAYRQIRDELTRRITPLFC